MFAFAIEDFYGNTRYNPKFMQWIVTYSFMDSEGNYFMKNYPANDCTDKDFAKFYPAEKSAQKKIELFKSQGGLYCFELPEEHSELYGYW